MSEDRVYTCIPMNASPSERTNAAAAIDSTVPSVTFLSLSFSVSFAVADCTTHAAR